MASGNTLRAFAVAAWLAAPWAQAAETPADQRIVIAETEESFQLSVPVSRLVMTFPRGGFVVDLIDEETDGPRYFSFADQSRGAILTGWFEPATIYKGIQHLWHSDVAAWKKNGLPEPVNVEFGATGRWETVSYDLEMPVGSNTHIRAQWSELGTWIDLHISVTSAGPIESARKAAQDILQSVQIAATVEE